MKRLNQAFTRIKKINWNDSESDKPSHKILIHEFIRRGNMFKDVYGKEGTSRLVIFSAAKIINALIPKDIQRFIDDIDLMELGWSMKLVCKYYLEWEYLINIENKVAIKHKDLYEPFIKLFERGGRISHHNNEILCGKSAWPCDCYHIPRNILIEDINDKILDAIDLGNE